MASIFWHHPLSPRRTVVPPTPGLPEYWLDVSNYQGNLTHSWYEQWAARGYRGLIAQAVTGNDGISYTDQQLGSALDVGWSIASYLWANCGDASDQSLSKRRLSLLDPYASRLAFLALDVEEHGLTPADVDMDLVLTDAYVGDSPIYTGKWFFDSQGWSDFNWWAPRRLWDSDYVGEQPEIDSHWLPYGGWTKRWMKQWTSTPLDQNTLRVAA